MEAEEGGAVASERHDDGHDVMDIDSPPTLAPPQGRAVDVIEGRRAQIETLMAAGEGADLNISSLDRPRASSASIKKRKSSVDASTTPTPPKKPRVDSEPRHVTAADRAREYAAEGFKVSNGTPLFPPSPVPRFDLIYSLGALFCLHCRKELALKASTQGSREIRSTQKGQVGIGKSYAEASRYGQLRRSASVFIYN